MSKKLSIIMQFALTMSTVRAGWRCDITVGERRCHGVQVANATLTAAELAEYNLKRHQHQPFEPPDHVPHCIWDDAVEGYTGKYALDSPDPKTSERCGNRTWSAYGGAACWKQIGSALCTTLGATVLAMSSPVGSNRSN